MEILDIPSEDMTNAPIANSDGLAETHQTIQEATSKEERVTARLADLRTEMRPPGMRTGELTGAEAIGHDIIAGAMQRHKGVTGIERRIRQKYAAERLSSHISRLRGEAE
ncbi:MAG TPA: hypothetical protein VGE30_02375 [Candidatus Saccharimonadales bacterium]